MTTAMSLRRHQRRITGLVWSNRHHKIGSAPYQRASWAQDGLKDGAS